MNKHEADLRLVVAHGQALYDALVQLEQDSTMEFEDTVLENKIDKAIKEWDILTARMG